MRRGEDTFTNIVLRVVMCVVVCCVLCVVPCQVLSGAGFDGLGQASSASDRGRAKSMMGSPTAEVRAKRATAPRDVRRPDRGTHPDYTRLARETMSVNVRFFWHPESADAVRTASVVA
jgi:hypothetical protein